MTDPLFGDLLKRYAPEAFGALGALIGLSFIERLTIISAALALLAGLAFAVIGSPIITHYIEPDENIREHVTGGLGLVLGLTGFVLAGAVVKASHALRDAAPDLMKKILRRVLGE
jgi:tellurite resistance protein TehA-like permease